jgi:pimeloyl-ACP methyl ester carboxylesterase
MNTTYHAVLSGHQKIAYRKDGLSTGFPPLVLLHGFCEDSRLWDGWLKAAPGLQVIRIDLPGFGQSDLAAEPSIAAYATAVKSVLHHESVTQCVMIGHSMGGYTALAFAELYPEYLCGMGLMHSHPFADTQEQKENRMRGIEMIRSGKKNLYVAQLFPKLFEDTFEIEQQELVQKVIQHGQEQSDEGIINALESMKNRPDRTAVLSRPAFPVLFVLGKKDVLIPFMPVLKVTTMVWQTELYLPDNVAHMGMYEAPEATAQMVKGFWAACLKSFLF